MSYFRYPLCMGNTRMCYKERHSLLLKYLITFLRYVRMIQGASDRILKPRMVHTVSFLPKITLKFRQNISFGAPSLHRKWENGMLCCKEKQPLLLKCFITFLRCIRMIVTASGSIYEPLMKSLCHLY